MSDNGAVDGAAWVKVDTDGLEEGRVTTVIAAGRALCLTRTAAGYGALDNHCPHQGGPLGDGQILDGYAICPWHAYEYDPASGKPPPGFSDGATAYAVEQRDDGLWVRLRCTSRASRSWTRWSTCCASGGSTPCSGWSGTPTSAWPSPAQGRGGRAHHLRRHPPRGGGRLLVLGASFSDHTGIATYVPTIQVDFDRMMRFRVNSPPFRGVIYSGRGSLLGTWLGRRRYPVPRTVWIMRGPCSSILRRNELMWTSTRWSSAS